MSRQSDYPDRVPAAADTLATVRVHVSLPLTGPSARPGREVLQGALTALEGRSDAPDLVIHDSRWSDHPAAAVHAVTVLTNARLHGDLARYAPSAELIVLPAANPGHTPPTDLRLRAVIDNGDFETYWAFHMRREHYRVHQARYQDRYDLLA